MIGKRIAQYEIVEKIGAGGMGEVYRARDTRLDRDVALKVLPAEMAANPERLMRFEREAKAVAALNHPNIVTIFSVEEAGGLHFLTMELVEGKSLEENIPRTGLSLARFFELTVALADAVSAAHERGITHRDLKPANIIVSNQGRLKVLDFGLAKLHPETAVVDATEAETVPATGEGRILGTLPYMAPEQIQGKPVDSRADIFSLGIVLYEMATGRRPFSGETAADLLSSILKDTPPTIGELKAELPRHLGRIIRRCLEKDPNRRFQTARDLKNELEDLRREIESGEILQSAAPMRRPQRNWWRWTAGAALVTLAVVLAAWWTQRDEVPQDGPSGFPVAQTDRKMMVVLPFENLGPPEDEYFAAGMTEEITSRLAMVSGLGVISRTSAVEYDRSGKTIQNLGTDLGVDYVLEGTVRWDRGGEYARVRVTPQLIRVSDDIHLWSEQYDSPLEDVFGVQTAIADQIIQQLDITLLAPEREALETKPTENLLAYEMYLRGLKYLRGAGSREEDYRKAKTLFRQAAQLDSSFALAFVRLSEVYGEYYFWGFDRTEERLSLARAAVDRALELQPDLPEAHRALGGYYYMGYFDYDMALKEYAIAAQGLPNDPEIMTQVAYIWRRQGLFEDAIANLHRAASLDPRNSWLRMQLGLSHTRIRDYAKADDYFNESLSLKPDQVVSYFFRSLNHVLWDGDLAKARAVLEVAPKKTEPMLLSSLYLLEMYHRDYREALDWLSDLPDGISGGMVWFVSKDLLAGFAHRRMNDPARARSSFETARIQFEDLTAEHPGESHPHSALGLACAALGRKAEAIREGKQAVELSRNDALGSANCQLYLARIYAMVGEHDAAIDLLEHLLSIPSLVSIPQLRIAPEADPLRDHPRFRRLLERES